MSKEKQAIRRSLPIPIRGTTRSPRFAPHRQSPARSCGGTPVPVRCASSSTQPLDYRMPPLRRTVLVGSTAAVPVPSVTAAGRSAHCGGHARHQPVPPVAKRVHAQPCAETGMETLACPGKGSKAWCSWGDRRYGACPIYALLMYLSGAESSPGYRPIVGADSGQTEHRFRRALNTSAGNDTVQPITCSHELPSAS